MIDVGGSSYNNGIKFISTNYSINFKTTERITKISLKKNEDKGTSKILDFMNKLPLIRGIVTMLRNSKPVFFLLLFNILLDILKTNENTNPKSGLSLLVNLIYFGILIILGIYIATKILKNIKLTWQYHGAEHKVISTNNANKAINLENCRKASRISDNCGTMLVCLFIFVYTVITVLFRLFQIHMDSSFLFLITWLLSYELFLLDRNTPVIRWIFKLGYWFQEHVCTLEPNDFQLNQAIEAFKLLEKAETGKIPDKELNELLQNGKQIVS